MSSNLALKIENSVVRTDSKSRMDPKEIASLFNMLNAKPDSIIKTFPRDVHISVDDIFNLKMMIEEKLEQYTLNGKVEIMSVRYENNVFKDFKDWSQFRDEISINSKAIENINLIWDFALRVNGYAMPQRHTIVVRLSSFMSKNQMMQMMLSGSIEDLDEIDKNIVPVMCKVEWANSSIGEEIIQIVGRWNEGLEVCLQEEDKFRKLRKYRMIIAHSIRYSFTFSSIFILSAFMVGYIQTLGIISIADLSITNLSSIIMFIPFIYIFIELSKRVGFNLGDKVFKGLLEYGDYHPFKISKGDLNKQKIIESNDKKTKSTIIKIMSTILWNIAISVIASIISNNISFILSRIVRS